MEERVIIQQRPPKSPTAAGILSVIFPGLGALYNGQVGKGLLHMGIFAGIITILARNRGGDVFFALALAGFWFYQIFDAVNSARAINQTAQNPSGAPATAWPSTFGSAPAGSIFWGIVLIVIGVVLILGNFDVIAFEHVIDFWPLVLIAIGLKLVFDYSARARRAEK